MLGSSLITKNGLTSKAAITSCLRLGTSDVEEVETAFYYTQAQRPRASPHHWSVGEERGPGRGNEWRSTVRGGEDHSQSDHCQVCFEDNPDLGRLDRHSATHMGLLLARSWKKEQNWAEQNITELNSIHISFQIYHIFFKVCQVS